MIFDASKLNDGQRVLEATRKGQRMLGPLERARCAKHPKRWETFRWSWPVPEDGEHLRALEAAGEAHVVRQCSCCAEEEE